MSPIIRPTDDKAFAENIIIQNMSAYYNQLDMRWDTALFAKQWGELDSYELIISASRVGLLCINHDENAYYIRELQIDQKWQRQGVGTAAIRYTEEIAKQAGIHLLRLRVFCINPASALYERMGFHVRKTEGGIHYMERRIL
ncbi:GNAT family N-acetyltransferase [Vreelandella neptunia]|uniref:GNAT family N-acetyltransferase n=1 Tax=Vreelandella neptunia TaxID=115551 RepID=A0ABZ0YJ58_9GAMM|nr:GNAT family N-acetyltransferase [Halomonas neptunia]MDN3561167.1 GNAT family N-acetyltransferase [Halomonas neptunia]TDW00231.1 ribosomal protein S18 acetylase RimI-like enzyme [Halomonas alkaliantarctica]WQH11302.1 GNAT family N-acetyltransferase [Halomonas neptunia]